MHSLSEMYLCELKISSYSPHFYAWNFPICSCGVPQHIDLNHGCLGSVSSSLSPCFLHTVLDPTIVTIETPAPGTSRAKSGGYFRGVYTCRRNTDCCSKNTTGQWSIKRLVYLYFTQITERYKKILQICQYV